MHIVLCAVGLCIRASDSSDKNLSRNGRLGKELVFLPPSYMSVPVDPRGCIVMDRSAHLVTLAPGSR
jgi:hypothetical protein